MKKNICFGLLSLVLILAPLSCNSTEKCNTTVPTGYNDPQPAIVPFNTSEAFFVVELPEDSSARCLDGSNYKFYIIKGSGNGTNKWVFYWQGAAFCGADGEDVFDSCVGRLDTMYGTSSSEYWGTNATYTTRTDKWGWFSSIEQYNPKFYNWNKVLLISCDGANFQGSIEEPIEHNGTKLYFRGMNNTLETMEYLRNHYGLFEASDIILGGGSSGATASYIWMAYLQDYFPKKISLVGLPDAGLFVDSYSEYNHCYLYRYFMQEITSKLNLSSGNSALIYRKCPYLNSTENFWKCLMVEYIYQTIDIPVFIINSENDFKQLTNLIGLGCINQGGLTACNSNDRLQIRKVREEFLGVVMKIKKDKPHWGFWLRTCFEHTYHFTWAWYGDEMDVFSAELERSSSAREALYRWYDNTKLNYSTPAFVDLVDWLHNPLCRYGPNQYDQNDSS